MLTSWPEHRLTPARPLLSGKQVLKRLRGGREVWTHGERVADVTAHHGIPQSSADVATDTASAAGR
jgi:aromatic ring hydroxylase